MCLPWWFSDVCTVGSHFTCQVYSTGWVAPVPLTGRGSFAASSWLVYGRRPIRVFAAHSEPLASPHASCSSHILIQQHHLSFYYMISEHLIHLVESLTVFYISAELGDWQRHQLCVHRANQRAWTRSGGGASFWRSGTRTDQWLQSACTQGKKLTLLIRAGLYSWISWYFLVFWQYLGLMIFICKYIIQINIHVCVCVFYCIIYSNIFVY